MHNIPWTYVLGSSRDHTFYGPSKGPRLGPQIQGPACGPRRGTKCWSQNRDQKLVPNYGSIFWTFLPMDPQQVHIFVPTQDHNLVPMHRSTLWTFMKVKNLDLELKVLILQEGPHRSHIGTMVMFYIRSKKSNKMTSKRLILGQSI